MPAMILNPFTGDNGGCWSNRSSNEIIFTAARSDLGATFNAIEPGAMQVRLSAPAARLLAVTGVIRDGEVFHAQLARFHDETAQFQPREAIQLANLRTAATKDGYQIDLGEATVHLTGKQWRIADWWFTTITRWPIGGFSTVCKSSVHRTSESRAAENQLRRPRTNHRPSLLPL